MQTEILRDPTNKRRWDRHRTRLRPVKLLMTNRRFLEDAMAVDISEGGVRIRRDGGQTSRLPAQMIIYDQSDRTFRSAVIAWASGQQVGMRFTSRAVAATAAQIEQLTGRAERKNIYVRR